MAFGTVTPRLFEETRTPDFSNIDRGANIGERLAELRTKNDPNRQFVEALKARVVEDAKARQVQNMFRGLGIDVPKQGGFNQMLGGVQDPTDVLKTASTIRSNQYSDDMNATKTAIEKLKYKSYLETGGDPISPIDRLKMEEIKRKMAVEDTALANKDNLLKNEALESLKTIQNVKDRIKYFGALGGAPTLLAPSTYSAGSMNPLDAFLGFNKNRDDRARWETNVDKLMSERVLKTMQDLKEASKTGATGFGQLSNKELSVLQNAATELRRTSGKADAAQILAELEDVYKKVLDPNYVSQERSSLSGGGLRSGFGKTASGNTFRAA